MADYTMSSTDKEKYRLQYSDLAPSLQKLIDSKLDRPDLEKLDTDINNYSKRMDGVVVTEDSSFPSNPITNKNVHLSTTNRLVYIYNGTGWSPVAMLPGFQIFGTNYKSKVFYTKFQDKDENIDAFTKIDFVYESGVATVKVAKGAKAEGELVISGTKGYIYVPAPWWKTDYFEVRFENSEDNKRFFYQLDGEGIRYEIVAFAKAIESGRNMNYVSQKISETITGVIEDFNSRNCMIELH